MMVRSTGSSKRTGTTPYREYMELRSTTRRPPPPYSEINRHKRVNLNEDSTSKQQNGSDKITSKEDADSPAVIIRSGCPKFSRCRYVIYSISGLSVFLLCAVLISILFPYPLHASCIVKWKFGDSCIYAMQKFRCQILNWSSCANCGPEGSRCLYTLKEPIPDENNVIRATHFAPNTRATETIKIIFEEVNKTCVATGESVSNEWFRIFDYGKNYCNLHNLAIGIGFDKSLRFLELTTNAVCTQYNMAICE